MKTGNIILFRLVIWFRKICFIKRTKFLLAYINIRVKLDKNNENSIGECEILQIDGFSKLFEEPTIQHVIGILS